MPFVDSALAAPGNNEARIDRTRRALMEQLQQIEVLMFRVLTVLLVAIVIYALATFALAPPKPNGVWIQIVLRVFAVLVCLLLASAAGGGILGFLFGIPRQLQQANTQIRQTAVAAAPGIGAGGNGTSDAAERAGEARAAAATSRLYGNNTNLEEISDWITKIIVGISLVQATTIMAKIAEASQNFKMNAMQEAAGADVVFVLVLIVGSVSGFLFFYLETRTRITMLFVDTDTAVDPNALLEQQKTVEAAASTQIADITGRGDQPGRAVSVAPIPEDVAMLSKRYEDLRTTEEFAAWGSAQARAGNLQPAIRALSEAIAKQPGNKELLKKLAEVHALQGNWHASYTLYSDVSASQPDDRDPELLKNVLVASLYLGPPESFQKALALIERIQAIPGTADDPFVQLWTAAAQAQRYDWMSTDSQLRPAVRAAALAAVKRVVALEPNPQAIVRNLLRQIFDPDRESSSQEENDLEVFKDDAEFRAVIYPGE
ncbi:MAG: tetratricopeptide repeat protein [Gammaproteobacteria bacterium]